MCAAGLHHLRIRALTTVKAHMDAIIPARVCALRTLRRRWLLPSDPVYTAAWGAGGDTVAVVVLPGFAVVVACCHCDGRVVLVTPMLSPLFCKVLSVLQSWFAVSCHISRPLHQLHLYHAKGRPVWASLTRPWCACEHRGVVHWHVTCCAVCSCCSFCNTHQ